ncbi:MAG TPA: hypothetical protein VFV81_08850, partial [Verrucomicrobiae bacterium]|nr:hypothetical protein [Verrucomicrobiae bacterium]
MTRPHLFQLATAALFFLAAAIVSPAQDEPGDSPQARRMFDAMDRGIFKARVDPHWLNDTQFWYRNDLPGGDREFILVNAAAGERKPAFDHKKFAAALSQAAGERFSAGKLPFETIAFV